MFESWVAGVPFVTADVGDRKILSTNPSSALLTLPGDAQDLALKIEKIVEDLELSQELRINGKKNVNNYLWKNLVNERLLPLL